MTLDEFKDKRNATQKQILKKLKSLFIEKDVVAIHQFGSFARGTNDDLSDMDMWFTFKDEDINKIVTQRDEIYNELGKVVIKYEPPQNAPVGGSYSWVIHEINGDLYSIDYYFSTFSKTKIRTDCILIWGDDSLPRGEWILDRERPFLNTSSSRIDFIICMSFNGVKYVVRNGKAFLDFLVEQYYNNKKEYFSELEELTNGYDFQTVRLILERHYPYANDHQKKAIERVKVYLDQVAELFR